MEAFLTAAFFALISSLIWLALNKFDKFKVIVWVLITISGLTFVLWYVSSLSFAIGKASGISEVMKSYNELDGPKPFLSSPSLPEFFTFKPFIAFAFTGILYLLYGVMQFLKDDDDGKPKSKVDKAN